MSWHATELPKSVECVDIPISSLPEWKFVEAKGTARLYRGCSESEFKGTGRLCAFTGVVSISEDGSDWILVATPVELSAEHGEESFIVVIGGVSTYMAPVDAVMGLIRMASRAVHGELAKFPVSVNANASYSGAIEAYTGAEALSELMYSIEYGDGALDEGIDVEEFAYNWSGASYDVVPEKEAAGF